MAKEYAPSEQSGVYCDTVWCHIQKLAENEAISKTFTIDQLIEMYRIGVEAQKVDMLHELNENIKNLMINLDDICAGMENGLSGIQNSIKHPGR